MKELSKRKLRVIKRHSRIKEIVFSQFLVGFINNTCSKNNYWIRLEERVFSNRMVFSEHLDNCTYKQAKKRLIDVSKNFNTKQFSEG